MAFPECGRRAPERTGNAPSKIEQLGGQLDRENSLSHTMRQARFLAHRFGVPPLRAAVVAPFAFGEVRS